MQITNNAQPQEAIANFEPEQEDQQDDQTQTFPQIGETEDIDAMKNQFDQILQGIMDKKQQLQTQTMTFQGQNENEEQL